MESRCIVHWLHHNIKCLAVAEVIESRCKIIVVATVLNGDGDRGGAVGVCNRRERKVACCVC